MAKRITYSFIIPALNEERLIGKTIKSIKKQKGSFEIIVVDNGSKDKTTQIAKDLGCRVVKEKERGISPARNRGAKEARGKYLCFIDADGKLVSNWLKHANRVLEKRNVDAVSGLNAFTHRNKYKQVVYNIWNLFSFLGVWSSTIFTGSAGLPGNNLIIEKSIFEKTGGFEPYVGEDIWLSKKFWSLGGKSIFVPRMLIYYSSRGFDESGFIKTALYWIIGGLSKKSSKNYNYKNKNWKKWLSSKKH